MEKCLAIVGRALQMKILVFVALIERKYPMMAHHGVRRKCMTIAGISIDRWIFIYESALKIPVTCNSKVTLYETERICRAWNGVCAEEYENFSGMPFKNIYFIWARRVCTNHQGLAHVRSLPPSLSLSFHALRYLWRCEDRAHPLPFFAEMNTKSWVSNHFYNARTITENWKIQLVCFMFQAHLFFLSSVSSLLCFVHLSFAHPPFHSTNSICYLLYYCVFPFSLVFSRSLDSSLYAIRYGLWTLCNLYLWFRNRFCNFAVWR